MLRRERSRVGGRLTKKIVQIEFSIDDANAEKIAGKILKEFNHRKGIFANYQSPYSVLPAKIVTGSREHALFMTYVTSINYLTDSIQLWKKSRAAYTLFPDRFTPEKILRSSPQAVETFVKFIGARQVDKASKTWTTISKILVEHYGGDPRNLTKDPSRILEIQRRLRLFPYLRGSKLSNHYIRIMGEAGLFKVKDLSHLNLSVDRQVARFTIYTGALKLLSKSFVGYSDEEPLKGLIQEVWRNASKQLETPPWKLNEPIAIVESLCGGKKCGKCPVDGLCEKKRIGIVFRESAVFWRRSR